MHTPHDPAAPQRGTRRATARPGLRLAIAAALAAAATGCGPDAPPPAQEAAAPEPPAPETTWVRLAAFGSDAPTVRRKTFNLSARGFRIITELREATTVTPGRVIANILSPRTTLPIRTVESRILPLADIAVDTAFVDAEPGEYTLYILHDFGVRDWSVVAEAPSVQEEPD